MTEFWLVSAPGENTPQKTWDRLNQATAGPEKLSVNYKFSIPELRVKKNISVIVNTMIGCANCKQFVLMVLAISKEWYD